MKKSFYNEKKAPEREDGMRYQPLIPRRPLLVREIYTVHYFENTGTCSVPGEQHDFWELLYVDKGEIQVRAGERT